METVCSSYVPAVKSELTDECKRQYGESNNNL